MLISVCSANRLAEDRARIHRRVDLLAVRHHRVARQRVVVLPARQLTNAADLAVNGAQARPVALPPDHALVISGRDLAAPLDQGAVGIEEKLRVVEGSAVTFVDADGHDDSRLFAGFADGIGGRRRHRHRLIEQLEVLTSANDLVGGLDERKVRVVRHHGFRERGELHALLPEFVDLSHDLVDRSLAAIENGTQLDRRGFHGSHRVVLASPHQLRPRPQRSEARAHFAGKELAAVPRPQSARPCRPCCSR